MISFTTEQRFIVTGASSGIGESVALLLNELGASVVGVGRNEERLAAMRAQAKHPEYVFLEKKELAEDIPGLPSYVKALKDKYGKFSGMAYCAGISSLTPLRAWEYADAETMFKVNYFAPVSMLKGIVDKRNNIGAGTSAVVVASASAQLADKGQCTYAATKAALIASMRVIAKEYAALGIRVNSVAPTVIRTPMTLSAGLGYEESQKDKYPMGFGEASDVASVTAFLLSGRARWITGHNYVVDCASF